MQRIIRAYDDAKVRAAEEQLPLSLDKSQAESKPAPGRTNVNTVSNGSKVAPLPVAEQPAAESSENQLGD